MYRASRRCFLKSDKKPLASGGLFLPPAKKIQVYLSSVFRAGGVLERELRGVMFAHSAFDDVRINEPLVRHTKRKAKVETLKSLARTCIPSPLSGRRGSHRRCAASVNPAPLSIRRGWTRARARAFFGCVPGLPRACLRTQDVRAFWRNIEREWQVTLLTKSHGQLRNGVRTRHAVHAIYSWEELTMG